MYFSIIFLLTLIIPFLIIPGYIKKGTVSPYRVVLISFLTITALATIVFMAAYFAGIDIYQQLYEIAKMISSEAARNPMIIEGLNAAGVSEEARTEMFMQIYEAGIMSLPASIMFTGAVVSYIAYIILSRIAGRKHQVIRMPKFREFTFGHGAAMAMMLMYIISWLMLESEMAVGELMYVNINMLFDLVFSLQGIAVVMMFFHFKKAPQAVAVVVCIFMWMTSIGKMFLVLMGMADLIIGLRVKMGGNAER